MSTLYQSHGALKHDSTKIGIENITMHLNIKFVLLKYNYHLDGSKQF